MTRKVLYMAHPVAPTAEDLAGLPGNLANAMLWLAWLRSMFPEVTFIAPWISVIQSLHGDDSQALRDAGLLDDFTVIERCDGIVLCGSRVSPGMRAEVNCGIVSHGIQGNLPGPFNTFEVYDLTGYQPEGESGRNELKLTFAQWMDRHQMGQTR